MANDFKEAETKNDLNKDQDDINVEKEAAEKLFKLLNILEENDDVQVVSSNFEVSDEILSSLTM